MKNLILSILLLGSFMSYGQASDLLVVNKSDFVVYVQATAAQTCYLGPYCHSPSWVAIPPAGSTVISICAPPAFGWFTFHMKSSPLPGASFDHVFSTCVCVGPPADVNGWSAVKASFQSCSQVLIENE